MLNSAVALMVGKKVGACLLKKGIFSSIGILVPTPVVIVGTVGVSIIMGICSSKSSNDDDDTQNEKSPFELLDERRKSEIERLANASKEHYANQSIEASKKEIQSHDLDMSYSWISYIDNQKELGDIAEYYVHDTKKSL